MSPDFTNVLYSVTFDGEKSSIFTPKALLAAWADSVPDLAGDVLDLDVGGLVRVFPWPELCVKRIR